MPLPWDWLLIALVALLAAGVIVDSLRLGAPPMPSSRLAQNALLTLLPEGGERVAFELGAGFGGLALALARARPTWRVVAYEAAWLPALVCRLRASLHRPGNLEVRRADLFAAPLAEADLLTCYLMPEGMARLRPLLETEGRPGALLLSIGFGIRGWEPERCIQLGDALHTRILRYRLPA